MRVLCWASDCKPLRSEGTNVSGRAVNSGWAAKAAGAHAAKAVAPLNPRKLRREIGIRVTLLSKELVNLKISHHAHVFVLKIMAMIQEQSGKVLEGLDNFDFLARHDKHGVFPATVDKAFLDSVIGAA